MRFVLASAMLALCMPTVASAQAPEPTSTPSPTPKPSKEDAALLKELEAAAAAPISTPATSSASTITGLSNVYNPAMSVNGLFLGSTTSREKPALGEVGTGIGIQELEVQFLANVDPYFQANLIFAIPEGEGIELEEGFLTPSAQPFGMAFRVGKIKEPFGRENSLHAHALPFIEKSLIGSAIFGDEGLSEPSGEVTYLLPLPWYTTATATAMSGDNEVMFASGRDDDLAGLGALKTVIDLTDDATVETGVSYAAGNNADFRLSQIVGSHVIFKWRPARAAATRSVVLAGEAIYAHRPSVDPLTGAVFSQNLGGAYGYAQVRLARRIYTAARFDYLGFPALDAGGITRKGSAILVFAPTEFSAVRLQGSMTRLPDPDEEPVFEGFLQLNFTLGAHPAHAY